MEDLPAAKIKNHDESCNSSETEDWQELSKSDYAKVIFCELYHHAESGVVGCKFQITDDVHEDPCDYVGLFRVGYEDLSQCIASKMLTHTHCEDDGKVLHCTFNYDELPCLEDGFYQFLYVTCGKEEICGASVPFEIKKKDLLTEEDGDFLLVKTALEKRTEILEAQLSESNAHCKSLQKELEERNACAELNSQKVQLLIQQQQEANESYIEIQEKLELANVELSALKKKFDFKQSLLAERDNTISCIKLELENLSKVNARWKEEIKALSARLREQEVRLATYQCREENVDNLSELLENQKCMIKALEHSKLMALKEISSITHTLEIRTDALNHEKHECASSKELLQVSETSLEKCIKEKRCLEAMVAEIKLEMEATLENVQKVTQDSEEKDKLVESLQEEVKMLKAQVRELVSRLDEAALIYHTQFLKLKKAQRKDSIRKNSGASSSLSSQEPQNTETKIQNLLAVASDSDTGEHNTNIQVVQNVETDTLQDVITCQDHVIIYQSDDAIQPIDAVDSSKTAVVKVALQDAITCQDHAKLEYQASGTDVRPADAVESSKPGVVEDALKNVTTGQDHEEIVHHASYTNRVHPVVEEIEATTVTQEQESTTIINLEGNRETAVENSSDAKDDLEECPCVMCDATFTCLENKSIPISFLDHIEQVHGLRMCPLCGHLYDAAAPKRYIELHIRMRHPE